MQILFSPNDRASTGSPIIGNLPPIPARFDSKPLTDKALGWLDIGHLKSGECVSYANLGSRQRFNLKGALVQRIAECLPSIDSEGRKEIRYTHQWPHQIGFDNCVQRIETDRVTFAQLKPSGNWIPLLHDIEATPTSYLNLVLKKAGTDKYILLVGAMGLKTPPSPSDKLIANNPDKLRETINFWNEHGLVAKWMYQNNLLIQGSEQTQCPWMQLPKTDNK